MHKINKILINSDSIKKLKKYGLESNYKKAKEMILSGHPENVDFKKRQPYKSEKYYFRLNKQYRAICFFDSDNNICVYEIDNHSY